VAPAYRFPLMELRVRRGLTFVGMAAALLAAGHGSAMALDGPRMHDGMGAPVDVGVVCGLLVAVVGTIAVSRSGRELTTVPRDLPQPVPPGRGASLPEASSARASPLWLQCLRR
jgi:hypothetical protein